MIEEWLQQYQKRNRKKSSLCLLLDLKASLIFIIYN